jgi:hypothetical protein
MAMAMIASPEASDRSSEIWRRGRQIASDHQWAKYCFAKNEHTHSDSPRIAGRQKACSPRGQWAAPASSGAVDQGDRNGAKKATQETCREHCVTGIGDGGEGGQHDGIKRGPKDASVFRTVLIRFSICNRLGKRPVADAVAKAKKLISCQLMPVYGSRTPQYQSDSENRKQPAPVPCFVRGRLGPIHRFTSLPRGNPWEASKLLASRNRNRIRSRGGRQEGICLTRERALNTGEIMNIRRVGAGSAVKTDQPHVIDLDLSETSAHSSRVIAGG